jgi:hypothetical protein
MLGGTHAALRLGCFAGKRRFKSACVEASFEPAARPGPSGLSRHSARPDPARGVLDEPLSSTTVPHLHM